MLACAIPLKTQRKEVELNRREVVARLSELPAEVELVVLPECTLTGYLEDPGDIARFAEDAGGPTTAFFAELAKAHDAWFVSSFIERAEGAYYIAAVLMDPGGGIALYYRKTLERAPYSCGTQAGRCNTPFANVAILLCGDLFASEAASQAGDGTDLLIVPMARCFDGNSPDIEQWECGERKAYVDQACKVAPRTLICNALGADENNTDFGGALWISREEGLLAEAPHGSDELLLVQL